ncbi:MAG: TIGR03009 domain-containing protein [Planctomycetales bacterium]|nr:TIGR03009 domain-containing protein [Planctomycetales bacterium]
MPRRILDGQPGWLDNSRTRKSRMTYGGGRTVSLGRWTSFAWTSMVLFVAAAALPIAAEAQQAPAGPPRPITPPTANQFSRQPAPPQPPFAPQSAEIQQFLDRVLLAWEDRSSKIKTYRATFQRFEYDSIFGPKDTYKTYSEGVIQYATPDKGMFRVDSSQKFTPAAKPGEKPSYVDQGESARQHWICDGTAVIEMNYSKKEMIRRELPAEMQGQSIADGPLPFLFGAKADKIKSRYWVRLVTPEGVTNEFHIEAWPKTQEDAANFKFAVVILDRQEFLPSGLVVYDVNFRPGQNHSRTSFRFDKREVNSNDLLSRLNLFHREFFEPALPSGWKKIDDKYGAPPAEQQRVAGPAFGPQRQ